MSSLKSDRLVEHTVLPLEGEKGIRITLPLINDKAINMYLRWQRNNRSLVRTPTKTRSQVICSDRKLRRQKGSGRARLGDASSPMLRGGAVAHGPKPLRRRIKMNKRSRRTTVLGLLGRLMSARRVFYHEIQDFVKTKDVGSWLRRFFGENERVLYVTVKNKTDYLSWRNLKNVKVIPTHALNVMDLLTYGKVLLDGEYVSGFGGKEDTDERGNE